MTILVTGGAGFIANTLLDSILSRGDSVICLDNLCRGTSANVARFAGKNSFRFSVVDLADLDAFRSCHRFARRTSGQFWRSGTSRPIPTFQQASRTRELICAIRS